MCIGGPLRLEPQILAKLVEQSFSNHRFEILLHLKIKTRPRKEFLHFICSYGISNLKLKNSRLKVTVSPLHINITFVRKRLPNPKSGKKKTRALSVLLNQNGAAWKKVPGLQCNHPHTHARAGSQDDQCILLCSRSMLRVLPILLPRMFKKKIRFKATGHPCEQ